MRLKLPLAIAALLLSISVALASNYGSSNGQSIQINLFAKPVVSDHDPEHGENRDNRHRLPGCPIPCTIGETGVTIQMDCEPEIISYDIYNAEGVLIAGFGDEQDFIQMLFSLTGEYTVTFSTSEYVYTGFVNI